MYKLSPTGVKVYNDYHSNVIIDNDNPCFKKMRGKKLDQICSENSEDALTWNVLKTFESCPTSNWLQLLLSEIHLELTSYKNIQLKFWEHVSLPEELLKHKEGKSEIDAIIETEKDVIFIEAKYKSAISSKTTYNPERNQIIRNIDVGSYYAKNKNFHFILLLFKSSVNSEGIRLLESYKDKNNLKKELQKSYIDNIVSINYLTGNNILNTINKLKDICKSDLIQNLINWLKDKELD